MCSLRPGCYWTDDARDFIKHQVLATSSFCVWVLMTRNIPGFSKTPGSLWCRCDMVFYYIPGFHWTAVAVILLKIRFQLGWCSGGASTLFCFFFLVNRVAPVCVNLSVCIRQWRRFFKGVNPANPKGEAWEGRRWSFEQSLEWWWQYPQFIPSHPRDTHCL